MKRSSANLDMKPKNVGTLEEYFVRGVQ